MTIRHLGLFAAAALLALGGCSSMSENECVTGDWYAIGYEDGSRGYTADQLGVRRRACAKHGVAPDFRIYQQGRAEGLQEFCQPQRGFNVGVDGGRYFGVCPADLEPDFIEAYRTGAQLHTLRSNVNAANHQISARENALNNIQNSIRSKEARLIASDTSIQERVLLIADLKTLNERTGELEAEIEALIQDRAVHEQELMAYEEVLAHSGY